MNQPADQKSLVLQQLEMVETTHHIGEHMRFIDWVLKNYRFREGLPFSFAQHEYLRPIYECDAKEIWVMKSSQCGISEWLFANAFYIGCELNANVFYAFPKKTDMQVMVQERVNPVISFSPMLLELMSKHDIVNNLDLKQLGKNYINFRGSQNYSAISSIQADAVLYDELDRMIQGHVGIIEKRADASPLQLQRGVSTPTFDEFGIQKKFTGGTQKSWFIKCPHCGKEQTPTFNGNLVKSQRRGVLFVCESCGEEIDRLMRGRYISGNPGAPYESFHISKLYTGRTDLDKLYHRYEQAMRGELLELTLQEFYNADMGVPYTPKGAQLTDNDLLACITETSHKNEDILRNTTMGVDIQGSLLRIVIEKSVDESKRRVIFRTIKYANSIESDLDRLAVLMERHDVNLAILDAQPETRFVKEFANRYPGRVLICYYPNDRHLKSFCHVDYDKHTVSVHRTSYMDRVRNLVMMRKIILPADARSTRDVFKHLKAPIRVIVEDEKTGDRYSTYIKKTPDDYFHAFLYAEVAKEIEDGSVVDLDLGDHGERTIEETFEKQNLTPEDIRKLYGEWFVIQKRLHRKLRRPPEDNEIRAELNVSEETYAIIYDLVNGLEDDIFNVPGLENSY